jgi:hypothetical protein
MIAGDLALLLAMDDSRPRCEGGIPRYVLGNRLRTKEMQEKSEKECGND